MNRLAAIGRAFSSRCAGNAHAPQSWKIGVIRDGAASFRGDKGLTKNNLLNCRRT